jgi:hypothetical protein
MIPDHSWRQTTEPHWMWLFGSLIAPASLLLLSLLGLGRGSFVSADIAAMVALIAVVIALAFVGIALVRRNRIAVAITAVGASLTALGFWWLHWVS